MLFLDAELRRDAVEAIFGDGIDTGDFAINSAWLMHRLIGQIAEATDRTVEEVFEAETAAALHEQVVVERINEVLNQDDED